MEQRSIADFVDTWLTVEHEGRIPKGKGNPTKKAILDLFQSLYEAGYDKATITGESTGMLIRKACVHQGEWPSKKLKKWKDTVKAQWRMACLSFDPAPLTTYDTERMPEDKYELGNPVEVEPIKPEEMLGTVEIEGRVEPALDPELTELFKSGIDE